MSSLQVVTVEITIDLASLSLQEVQLQTISVVHTYLQGEGALVGGSVSFSVYIGITISTGEKPRYHHLHR